MENEEVAAKQAPGTKRKTPFQLKSLEIFYLGIIILFIFTQKDFIFNYFFFLLNLSSDFVALRPYCLSFE